MLRVRRVGYWSVITGLWLVLALPVAAQSGSVQIFDPDNVLRDQTAIKQAAQSLANEGAQVIVVAAGPSAGTDPQNPPGADAFLNQFLAQNNIAPGSRQLDPNQIVFFVARDARRTSLLYGSRWRQKLDPVFQQIQAEQMNPRFAAGDLPGGLVAGINAVRTTINPPIPTFVWLLGGVLALTAIGAVVLPMLRRRREAATTLAGARERMEQAKRAAGAAIADLGRLVEQAQAKAQYDRISYGQSDVQRLQTLQGNGLQLFQEAQTEFAAAGEQERAKATLNAADYEAIAGQYDKAQETAQQANAAISEAEQLRATLDARGTPSTGPTTRLGE